MRMLLSKFTKPLEPFGILCDNFAPSRGTFFPLSVENCVFDVVCEC